MHAVPRFLWNAKTRFGKTFTTYQLAKKLAAGVRQLFCFSRQNASPRGAYSIDGSSRFLRIGLLAIRLRYVLRVGCLSLRAADRPREPGRTIRAGGLLALQLLDRAKR
jgi:hypothetical protein